MVYTKLERSFDSKELHQMLAFTLHDSGSRNEEEGGFRRIERPPMPRGSSVFEQAKGELEIEKQSEKNGKSTLPTPTPEGRSRSGRSRLSVPLTSPVPQRWGTHYSRHNSARRSPSPFGLAVNPRQSGRHSPFLQVPTTSRPSSARSNQSSPRSRSVSPR